MFWKTISGDTQWVSSGYSLGITSNENNIEHFMSDLQLDMGPIWSIVVAIGQTHFMGDSRPLTNVHY
jgi:hypothetical protein